MTSSQVPLLSMSGITKQYPGTKALDAVDFEIRPGEMVGLLGKNGAGKSTLIKVMAGLETPDSGSIAVDGETVPGWSARAAADAHFDFVFQELEEFPALSVTDNVMLGSRLPKVGGMFVSERRMRAIAAKHLESVDCRVDPSTPMSQLTPVQRRLVMVARALAGDNRLLVLDEPTAALTPREVDDILNLCRRLRDQGTAIIYVSHRLTEVLDLVDRIVVLRDGVHEDDRPRSEFDLGSLIDAISGHTGVTVTERVAPAATAGSGATPVLSVRGLSDGSHFEDIDLDLHPGESLGIAGLVGAGRTELLTALVGDAPTTAGTVTVDGREVRYRGMVQSLADGIVLLPEERRAQGLIGTHDVQDNITLSALGSARWHPRVPLLSRRRERAAVAPLVSKMQMKISGLDQEVRTLSGGTQQKVITARALLTGSRIIIMDEPTAGIDVEAKEEIYELVDAIKAEGRSVIVVSSDFTELIRMSDRVLVMSSGRSAGTLSGDDVTPANITRLSYAFAQAATTTRGA